MKVFSVLQRFKGLRGTAFDIFGYSEERKLERADIGNYFELLDEIKSCLTKENYDIACELAALPLKLRGYGPVKTTNRGKLAEQQSTLIKRFRGETVKYKEAA